MEKRRIAIIIIIIALLLIILNSLSIIVWKTSFVIKEDESKKISYPTTLPTTLGKEKEEKKEVTGGAILEEREKKTSRKSKGSRGLSSFLSFFRKTKDEGGEESKGGVEIGKGVVNLEVDSYSGSVNDEFIINVKISTSSDTNVYAVDFVLSYDKNILNVTEVEAGDFLKKGGVSVYPVLKKEEGKITFAATRYSTKEGVSGSGVLAKIKFKAINKGESQLTIEEATITNNNLQKIEVKMRGGEVKVS